MGCGACGLRPQPHSLGPAFPQSRARPATSPTPQASRRSLLKPSRAETSLAFGFPLTKIRAIRAKWVEDFPGSSSTFGCVPPARHFLKKTFARSWFPVALAADVGLWFKPCHVVLAIDCKTFPAWFVRNKALYGLEAKNLGKTWAERSG